MLKHEDIIASRSQGPARTLLLYRQRLFKIDKLIGSVIPLILTASISYGQTADARIFPIAVMFLIPLLACLTPLVSRYYHLMVTFHVVSVTSLVVISSWLFPFILHEYLLLPVLCLSIFVCYPYPAHWERVSQVLFWVLMILSCVLMGAEMLGSVGVDDHTHSWFQAYFTGVILYISGMQIIIAILIQRKAVAIGAEQTWRYLNVFENNLLGIVVLDENALIQDANAPFCSLMGYSYHATRGLGFRGLILPADQPIWDTAYQQLQHQEGQSFIREIRYERQDGVSFVALASVQGVYDDERNFTYAVVTLQDITDQKQAGKALQKAVDRYQALLEALPGAVLTLDASYRITYASRSMVSLFQYDAEELMGMSVQKLVYPEDTQGVEQRLARLFAGHQAVNETMIRVMRKGGIMFYAEGAGRLVEELPGGPRVALITFQDVSDKIFARQQLAYNEERYRSIFSISQFGILTIHNAYITRANPAYCQMIGYPEEHMTGLTLESMVHPEDYPELASLIRQVGGGEIGHGYLEYRYIHKNGYIGYAYASVGRIYHPDRQDWELVATIADISAQKQAERALRESEVLYKTLFENSPLGILVVDTEGRRRGIIANRTWSQMMECSMAEAVEGSLLTFSPEFQPEGYESQQKLQEVMERYRYTRENQVFEWTFRSVRGKQFLGQVIFTPFHWMGAENMMVIVQDISELKEKQLALLKSEKRYRDIFENSHLAIFLVDLTLGHPIDCNQKTLELFGCETKAQFMAEKSQRFTADVQLNGESAAAFYQRVTSTLMEKGTCDYIKVGLRLDNSTFIGDATAILDVGPHGSFALFFISDITTSFYAQREIQERKAIYQALLDQSFEGIDIIEIIRPAHTQHLDGRLILRNEVMKKMVGDTCDLLIQVDSLARLTPDILFEGMDWRTYQQQKSEALIRDRRVKHSWALLQPDGSHRELEVDSQLVSINDKAILIRVCKDVTEERTQQRLIQEQVQHLNQKNRELQQYIDSNMQLENFASMASHDLQAPLRTIISFSQLLERSMQDRLTEEEAEFLQFILQATHNMQSLITALLTYARVNTTEMVLEHLNLPELLDEIEFELTALIQESGAVIHKQDIPEVIVADRIKMRQLFQNLLINGMKFRQTGQQPVVTISCQSQPGFWYFEVTDNGIGIEAQYFEKIFVLFRRLHRQDRYEGTGIGLPVCKTVVEQHGGQIGVRSEPGAGSTFYFTLKK